MVDDARLNVVIDSTGAALGARRVNTAIAGMDAAATKSVRNMTGTFDRLKGAIFGVQGAIASIGVGVGLGVAIRQFAQFEKSISEVRAVTGATDRQMASMEKSARSLGATTVFSAKQAAEGMAFLGRAGFATDQIIAAMPGTLALATAGALDLGRAADIASNILSQFALDAAEMARVSDVLAKTAASANTSVEQLGQGLKFVGPLAGTLGLQLEELSAAMGVLGNSGLQADIAGTGLRATLLGLTNPTTKVVDAVERLGLTMEQVSPKTKTLNEIINTLAKAGAGVGETFAIAGQRGGLALQTLVDNADGLRKLTGELENAKGAAQEMADIMSDNLSGAVTRLGSVLGEINLSVIDDSGIGDSLKNLVDAISGTIQVWTQFSDELGDDEKLYRGYAHIVEGLAGGFAAYAAVLVTVRAATIGATLATTGFTAALTRNPIGLVAVGLSTAVAAIIAYRDELGLASEAETTYQKALKAVSDSRDQGLPIQAAAITNLQDETRALVELAQAELVVLEAKRVANEQSGAFAAVRAANEENLINNIKAIKGEIEGLLMTMDNEHSAQLRQEAILARMNELRELSKKGIDEESKAVDKGTKAYDSHIKALEKFRAEQVRQQLALRKSRKDMVEQVEVNARMIELIETEGRPAAEKYRLEQELLNKAQAAGIEVTDEYRDSTKRLVEAFVNSETALSGAKTAQEKATEAAEAAKEAQDKLAEAAQEAAREFEDAWSNSISAINSLFDDLFGGIFDKLGKFGGIAQSLFNDVVGQVLKANGQTGGGLGSLIMQGVTGAFGGGGSGSGGFSLSNLPNPLTFLSSFGAPSIAPVAAGGLGSFASTAGAGFGAGTFAEFGGVAGASGAFGGISGAALGATGIGLVVAPIIAALMAQNGDGPAFGARLGINASGGLDIADVRTDDGFSEGTANEIANAVKDFGNLILAGSGLSLKGGAFRGEIAFNAGRFKSSAAAPSNASTNDGPLDASGIVGLGRDSRQFDNANQAMADFVARNMFLAIKEGNVEGLTTGMADVLQVGLGNIIRRVRDDVSGEADGLDQFAEDIGFLTTFGKMRDALYETAIAADDASKRLQASQESQKRYNDSLAELRTQASQTAVSGLSGLGSFIDNAHRLFDPTGGDETQIRLRLGGPGGKAPLDVTNATAIGSFFDTDNGVDRSAGASFFDASRLGLFKNPGVENFGPGQGGFSAFGVRFTNTSGEGGAFGEAGQPNVFSGGNDGIEFNQPGTGGGFDLTIDARMLVKALTGQEDLDFGEAIMDPLFAAGTGLIVDSFRVATKTVDEFFAQFTGENLSASGPLALFEELTPAINPLVEEMINLKASVEATRPDLEALNEDFEKFGVSLIDIDAKIKGATDAIDIAVQDQFLAGLGITVDKTGTVQTGVDVGAVNTLAQTIKDLDAGANTLFENDPRGVLPEVQEAINAELEKGILAIVGASENKQATISLIEDVLGVRGAHIDFADLLDRASVSTEDLQASSQAVSSAMRKAAADIEDDIRTQEELRNAWRETVEALQGAKSELLTDSNLSTLNPVGRLNEARRRFNDLVKKSQGDDEEARAAANALGSAGKEYLTIARGIFASSQDYVTIFNEVQGALSNAEANAAEQVDKAQRQVELLTEIRDSIVNAGGLALQAANDNRSFGKSEALNRALAAAIPEFTEDFGNARFSNFIRDNQQFLGVANAIREAFGDSPLTGFSSGGVVGLGGDNRLAFVQPGEGVVSVPGMRNLERLNMGEGSNDNSRMMEAQLQAMATMTSEMRNMRQDIKQLTADNARLTRSIDRLASSQPAAGRTGTLG